MSEGLRPGIEGAVQDLRLYCAPWGLPLAEIDVPAIVWQGSDDTIVPPAAAYALARTLPNCRLDVIPAAGHYWVFGQFGLVLDAVAAALRAEAEHRRTATERLNDPRIQSLRYACVLISTSRLPSMRLCRLRIVKEHGKGNRGTVWHGACRGGCRSSCSCCSAAGPRALSKSKADMTHYGFAVASRADVEELFARVRKCGKGSACSGSRRNFRRRPAIICAVEGSPACYIHRVLLSAEPIRPKRLVIGEHCSGSSRMGCGVVALERKALARKSRAGG